MVRATSLLLAACLVAGALASCPNLCSNHGSCSAFDKCTCHTGFYGVDCSLAYCPFGLAWGDAPTATDTAHGYAECSNRGTCDTKSAECKCFPGFEGKACRRATCPNDCSGHGQCLLTTDADISSFSYGLWDSKKVQICKCDPGYQGSDCSQRMCPKGDDPLTVVAGNKYTVQTVTISDGDSFCSGTITGPADDTALVGGTCAPARQMSGSFTLTYKDQFGGSWTTRPIMGVEPMASSTGQYAGAIVADMAKSLALTPTGADAGTLKYASNEEVAAMLRAELLALPNKVISDVSVTSSVGPLDKVGGETFREYAITFYSAGNADSGAQNALECNYAGCTTSGCQPYFAGLASGIVAPDASAAFCRVAVATAAQSLVESAECSNRGLCDRETGVCTCAEGYTRHDCSVQTVLV